MTFDALIADRVRLYRGDAREGVAALADASIDAIVTDPPYALVSIGKRFGKPGAAPARSAGATGVYQRASAGFMGQAWDTGETAFDPAFWAECLRVLKPGGHVVAFGGTRTYHRLVCAIEDAGFEIRDQLAWLFGSGFPKSHDVSKGIDKASGAARQVLGYNAHARPNRVGKETKLSGVQTIGGEVTEPATDAAREWDGWGTALKPAHEPIVLARKPLIGTVAANVLAHGTGAIHVDACRVAFADEQDQAAAAQRSCQDQNAGREVYGRFENGPASLGPYLEGLSKGRFPANVVHDGSDEVVGAFPKTSSGEFLPHHRASGAGKLGTFEMRDRTGEVHPTYGDSGSAARFFYSAKADADDRVASKHPTVKPVDLMQWLVRLITPRGGVVLDPSAGSGTTGEAAWREGCRAVLIEREAAFQEDISRRMHLAERPAKRAAIVKGRGKLGGAEGTPLFAPRDGAGGEA